MILTGAGLCRGVIVVAEIGNNHEGDPVRAAAMIAAAAAAGADAIKLQTYRTEEFISRRDHDRFERLQAFQLTEDETVELGRVARRCGVGFISTPLDLQSVALLEPHVDALKIASSDNTFVPMLEAAAKTRRTLILSTGMATEAQIEQAVKTVEEGWATLGHDGELILLHCVSAYPVPPEEANLAAIATLCNRFGWAVGYSDHTLGIEAAVAAGALGARLIEKHFTLDKFQSDYRDHQLSADPGEFGELVRRVRLVETMRGDGSLQPRACERRHGVTLRRSPVFRRDVHAGTRLRYDDVAWVRPGGGLDAAGVDALYDRRLLVDVVAGDPLLETLLGERS